MIIEAAYLWVGFLGVAYILWKGTFLFCMNSTDRRSPVGSCVGKVI